MKKLLYTLLAVSMIFSACKKEDDDINVNIPDAIFKAYLVDNSLINTNGDTEIQVSEASVFNGAIDCGFLGVTDLTGIEAFTALTNLNCEVNQLTSLNLSQNTVLTYLRCDYNQLSSLNVKNGNNTNFTYFYSKNNPNLTCINVDNAAWSTANWSKDPQSFFSNNCSDVTFTYVPDNNFESYLEANGMGNSIPNDDYVNTANINTVNYLDVSYQNIADLTGIEAFTALTYLYCEYNQLTSLNVSQNTALTQLYCGGNQLTSLDVSQNTALTDLYCYFNQLTSLDVSQNTALTYLYCGYNQLTSLDVSQNTALTYLDCRNNQLTSLNVSQNTALTYLDCGGNQLTSLNVSQNTALTTLYCYNNQLTSLDVSQNTALTTLYCGGNQLTSLDVSQNTALTYLYCSGNPLTSLDVSQNTALTNLRCGSNQLTSLDVRNGNNTNIYDFEAPNNPNLYCIDVDDASWSTANWTYIDPQSYFSNNCGSK